MHDVSLERYTEPTPGEGIAMDICRARLLIKKPRRAVTLDETSNHQDDRVRAVARQVAEFLDVPIEESGR